MSPFRVRIATRVRTLSAAPAGVRWALLVAASLAVTFFMVRGIVYPFDGLTFYRGRDYSDVGQMVWNLWSMTEAVLSLHNPLHSELVFHPQGANLATHTLSLGYLPIPLLAKLLSGGSPMYPIYAYNIATLFAYASILLFTFLALREAGFGVFSSAVPALGYAFCDFYCLHWLHLNHLAGFALPLFAWLAVRLWKRPTFARSLGLAAAFAWAVYLTEFALSIGIAALLFLVSSFAFRDLRRGIVERARALGALKIGAAVALFAILVAPFVAAFFASDVTLPETRDFSRLSANAAGLFVPSVKTTPLYGDLFAPLASRIKGGLSGGETFLGYPILLAALIGLARQRTAISWIAFCVALVFFSLSFGPTLKVFSSNTGIRMPYAALMGIPPFDQNRCPVRFAVIGHFFLLYASARGLEWVFDVSKRRLHVAVALCFVAGMAAWTLLECRPTPPGAHRTYAPPSDALAQLVPGPVVHADQPQRACNAALLQVFHGHPIANGCLARTTKAQQAFVRALRTSFGRDWDEYARLLRRGGFENIVVSQHTPPRTMEKLRAMHVNIVELDD